MASWHVVCSFVFVRLPHRWHAESRTAWTSFALFTAEHPGPTLVPGRSPGLNKYPFPAPVVSFKIQYSYSYDWMLIPSLLITLRNEHICMCLWKVEWNLHKKCVSQNNCALIKPKPKQTHKKNPSCAHGPDARPVCLLAGSSRLLCLSNESLGCCGLVMCVSIGLWRD